MEITLSEKQTEAWQLLDRPEIAEVFAGGGAGCFASDTLINTRNGYAPICDVKKGDNVLSFNTITKVFEYKKVTDTFTHNRNHHTKKFIIFKFNNVVLKCTDNHEFYFRGAWNTAGDIAKRAMEVCSRNRRTVSNIEYGATVDNGLQGRLSKNDNETSKRRSRVLSDNDKTTGAIENNQNTSHSCSNVDTKSRQQADSKSHELSSGGQSCIQSSVGNVVGECQTRLRTREYQASDMHQLCERFEDRHKQTDRKGRYRDQTQVQIEGTYPKNIGEGIRGFSCYDQGCDIKEVEPCSARLEFSTELTYDLCVEDNHNYCVTTKDIIAHNSGKSVLGCVRQIYRRMTYADTRGFIGRRDFTSLRDSTLKTYFKVLSDMGYVSDEHYKYNAQEHTIFFHNGSEQHFRHMAYQPSDPDYNRFGSTEYTDAFIDEAPEVDKRAAQVVLSRLRYNHSKHGITKEILYTGNPSDSWVKYAFVMDEKGDFIDLPEHRARVLFTVMDNPDNDFVKDYVRTLELLDDYDRARLLYGDWKVSPTVERPFAHAYDPNEHLRGCEFQPQREVYMSVDFNLDPFAMTFSHIWEDMWGLHIHVFDELTISSGTLHEAAEQVRAKYGHVLHNFHLTGDYSGNARSMQSPDNESNYKMLVRLLGLNNRQTELKPNPRHANSRSDVNFVFAHAEDVRVDPKCVNLDRDFRTVEVDAKEGIIKSDRKKTGQRADHLDAFRYMINSRVVKDWIRRKQMTLKHAV